MALGVIAFVLMSLRARPADKHHYLTSILIVVIATASYFAMAIGQTHLQLSDGHSIYIARYIDWAFTTPLLLLGTATIGMRAFSVNKTLVYAAIGADVNMIVTGLAGGLSVDRSRAKVAFGFFSLATVAALTPAVEEGTTLT